MILAVSFLYFFGTDILDDFDGIFSVFFLVFDIYCDIGYNFLYFLELISLIILTFFAVFIFDLDIFFDFGCILFWGDLDMFDDFDFIFSVSFWTLTFSVILAVSFLYFGGT